MASSNGGAANLKVRHTFKLGVPIFYPSKCWLLPFRNGLFSIKIVTRYGVQIIEHQVNDLLGIVTNFQFLHFG